MEGFYEPGLEVKYILLPMLHWLQFRHLATPDQVMWANVFQVGKEKWFAEEGISLCHKPLGLDFLKNRRGKGEMNSSLLKMRSEIESRFKESRQHLEQL